MELIKIYELHGSDILINFDNKKLGEQIMRIIQEYWKELSRKNILKCWTKYSKNFKNNLGQ